MAVSCGFRTLCLCLAAIVSLAHPVLAVEFAGGTGEPNDPYQIATPDQLVSIGSDPNLLHRHFVLVNDIDLDPNLPRGQVFSRALVARSPESRFDRTGVEFSYTFVGTFTGTFHGNGHVIRNLHIDSTLQSSWIGLFGFVGPKGRVEALRLEGVEVTGGENVGAVAGENWGTITQCHVTGLVRGHQYVGGLVGTNGSYSLFRWGLVTPSDELPLQDSVEGWIFACGTDVQVVGETGVRADYFGSNRLGGLVGQNKGGMIYACRAAGSVDGREYVGGLVGYNHKGWIRSSYATNRVHASRLAGGVTGYNSANILFCYAAGMVSADTEGGANGIAGLYPSSTYLCYWDQQTTGCGASSGGRAKTTDQMKSRATFCGWGYENQWVLADGRDYPRLAWEGSPDEPLIEGPAPYAVGDGTLENPYQISTAEQVVALGYDWPLFDRHFLLTADIDLSDVDPNVPVAIGTRAIPFTGSFDGNGHRIAGSRLWSPHQHDLGMFGCTGREGVVKDLTIVASDVRGRWTVGILAGCNEGTIQNCRVDGHVHAFMQVGAISGLNGRAGTIVSCVSAGEVAGLWEAGGLVGDNAGRITACCSRSVVGAQEELAGGLVATNWGVVSSCCSHGSVRSVHAVGGLVAWNGVGGMPDEPELGEIHDCYADGAVEGSIKIGGLAGVNMGTIRRCYSAGTVGVAEQAGGLLGFQESISFPEALVADCYWDIETSGTEISAGGTGRASGQMQQQAGFQGWDFENTWTICEGKDYPRLRWEQVQCE